MGCVKQDEIKILGNIQLGNLKHINHLALSGLISTEVLHQVSDYRFMKNKCFLYGISAETNVNHYYHKKLDLECNQTSYFITFPVFCY